MIEEKKAKQYAIMGFAVWLVLLLAALWHEGALAGGNHNNTTVNNYYTTEVTEVTEISNFRASGLSDSQIIELSSGVLAGGSHQFDFSTTHLQLSVTGATTTSDWDEDSHFSFGMAKRFGKDHWMPNALWHVSYTPDIMDESYIHGGATIVLDQ